MASSQGALFRVHTWGESHGGAVGAVVDGCPPGLPVDARAIQHQLDRRRPGRSPLASPRDEPDVVEIVSGVEDGIALGSPICLLVRNRDARPGAYADLATVYRPSHADFTTEAKYGLRSASGGGRASARETVGRVAAGALARQVLAGIGVGIVAWTERVGCVEVPEGAVDEADLSEDQVDGSLVRCPHPPSAAAMEALVAEVRDAGDSIGGTVRCVARGVPAGWGEPVFDKLHSDLARACMSIPAARGFEVGSGFAAAAMRGSEHNDAFEPGTGGGVSTRTNRSGGIQGGISNGQPIRLRVAFKPAPTIRLPQDSVDRSGRPVVVRPGGRHDPCVVPRAVPVVEAMVAIVLCDHYLRQRALRG